MHPAFVGCIFYYICLFEKLKGGGHVKRQT